MKFILSLWIILFGLLGLYLLGKLKFKHDDHLPMNDYGLPYLSVTRIFFAIGALSLHCLYDTRFMGCTIKWNKWLAAGK
ncbi:MAG: hypothetical protein WKF59_25970 [Chitinophagaceae bacterium]